MNQPIGNGAATDTVIGELADAKAARDYFAIVPRAVHTLRDAYATQAWTVLALHADRQTKKCSPSMKTIAAKMGCNPKTARGVIQRLVAAGFVTIDKRRLSGFDQSNEYTLRSPYAPWTTPSIQAIEDEAGDSWVDQRESQRR